MKNNLDIIFDFLVENEIRLVTCINGYNETALNDIIYVKTGYRTLKQYKEFN